MRGRWVVPPFIRVIKRYIKKFVFKKLLSNPDYQTKFSFRLVQWNAAYKAGMRFRMFFNCHTPHVVNRKILEAFFTQNRPLFEKNISYRFRDQAQFNMSTLANHLEIISGNRNTAKINLEYIVPSYYSKRKMHHKVEHVLKDRSVKSVCIQSLDSASKEDQKNIFNLMDQFLGIKN